MPAIGTKNTQISVNIIDVMLRKHSAKLYAKLPTQMKKSGILQKQNA